MKLIEMKDTFCEILRSTGRKGVENVIAELDKLGFFTAPASRKDHGAYPGGLLEHSLHVYRIAMLMASDMRLFRQDLSLSQDSIALACLLHDVSKSNRYVPNPDPASGEKYLKVYPFPLGHGEKSLVMLLCAGLELTQEEMAAIRYHMSPWDLALTNGEATEDYCHAENTYPLLSIVQASDKLSAKVLGI